jgi:hypothetical protein
LQDYPDTSIAQIAETTLGDWRLVVRRVRRLSKQGELLPVWDHYPFATNRLDALALVEVEHRRHAVVELCIRDLKDQALAHYPSGKFTANAAWTVIAALAHNLLRWIQTIGLPNATTRTARTLASPTARTPRPPGPFRAPPDATDARSLALGARLPRRPRAATGAATTRLTGRADRQRPTPDSRPRPAQTGPQTRASPAARPPSPRRSPTRDPPTAPGHSRTVAQARRQIKTVDRG